MYPRIAVPLVTALVAASATASAAFAQSDTARQVIPVAAYGEIRTRSEWDRPMFAAQDGDFFTLMRSRLGIRITPSATTRLVLEGQDSRVLGDVSATARQSFELHQGYLEFNTPTGANRLTVRAGRQEIALANERLVGAVGWSNYGRAFDGVRVGIASGSATRGVPSWGADAFAVTLEERGPRFGANRTSPAADHLLAGVYLAGSLPSRKESRAELTGVLDVGADFRTYHDAKRGTVDLRLRDPRIAGLKVELEGALQHGRQHFVSDTGFALQNVRAWLAGVRIGSPATSTTRLDVTVGADVLSGDSNARDGSYSAFNTLYGTNHPFYGLIDLFLDPGARTRDRGLRDVFIQSGMRLGEHARLRAELHRMEMATGHNRNLGWEADVVLPIRISNEATVDLGYSAFRAADGAESIGLGKSGATQHWAFLQLRAAFQR